VVVEEEEEEEEGRRRTGEEGELELGEHLGLGFIWYEFELKFFRVKLRIGVESECGSF